MVSMVTSAAIAGCCVLRRTQITADADAAAAAADAADDDNDCADDNASVTAASTVAPGAVSAPAAAETSTAPKGACYYETDGDALHGLFAFSDDEPDDIIPPPQPILHEPSGVRLRAFGIAFGATTGLCVWPAANVLAEVLMDPRAIEGGTHFPLSHTRVQMACCVPMQCARAAAALWFSWRCSWYLAPAQ